MLILAISFLIVSYYSGYVLTRRFFPSFTGLLVVASAIVVGLVGSVWLVLLFSMVSYLLTDLAIIAGLLISLVLMIYFIYHQRTLFFKAPPYSWKHIVVFLTLLFCCILFFSSLLGYDRTNDLLLVDQHYWNDFGIHLPFARSFSLGNNLALENPLFANEKLLYHFMFDFSVGVMEKAGMSIDFAISLLSSLFSTSLMILIYYLGKSLFYGSRFVGILSVALFLFNSSLSFIFTFKHIIETNPNSTLTSLITSLWGLKTFVTSGPWNGHIIGAFSSNWIVYIHQRHIFVGFCLVLLILLYIIKEHLNKEKKAESTYSQYIFAGTVTGLSVFWYSPTFICLLGCLGLFFILFPDRKKTLVSIAVAFLVALPQIIWLNTGTQTVHSKISIYFGFYVDKHLLNLAIVSNDFLNNCLNYILSFSRYWFYNIGLSFITIITSFFVVDRNRKKIYLIFLSLFILGNTILFSRHLVNNHKFFNLWLILSNVFTAYLVMQIFRYNWFGRILSLILIVLLTLSGIVNLIPLKNAATYKYSDYRTDPIAKWVSENTEPESTILTNNKLYNRVTFTGRSIMWGYDLIIWVMGHDAKKRLPIINEIYGSNSKERICSLLTQNGIDYVVTEKQFEKKPKFVIDYEFYKNTFPPKFTNIKSKRAEQIYSTADICKVAER